MIQYWTNEVVADSLLYLQSRQLPVGLNDGPLAMDPMRFDGVQPGTLRRQEAREYTYSTGCFSFSIVLADPSVDHRADVPGGIIPYQEQGFLTPMP